MSLLAELIAEEKIPAAEKISAPPAPPPPAASPQPTGTLLVAPCQTCNSPLFWLSVYRDAIVRCRECQPPPSPKMVRAFLAIVPRTRSIPGGGDFQFEALNPDGTPHEHARPGSPGTEPSIRIHSDAHIAQHYPPWPNDRKRRSRLADTLAENLDHCPRCSSREFRDTEIHAGRSTRRDCARCGITWGFPRWSGSDGETPVLDPLAGLF